MLLLSTRAFALRFLLVAAPFGIAAAFGVTAGCSDLIAGIPTATDGGALAPGDDGGLLRDGSLVGVDAQTVDGAAPPSDDAAPFVNCAAEDAGFGAPNDLQCTGLYASFATKTIATTVQAYDPGLHLWADGATEQRWISLPAGKTIDTTDMNEWSFPAGTKLWQEFSIGSERVETRYMWKRGANDWVRGTYAWSGDQTQATYLSQGATNVGGSTYQIPSLADCDSCHLGRIDRVLGFEAVSLATPAATGLNLSALIAQKLISAAPTGAFTIPDDGSGRGTLALGWLHANCGTSCHNGSPGSSAGTTGLLLRLDVATPDGGAQTLGTYQGTNTYVTSVNVTPTEAPFAALGWKRITPHDSFALDGGLPGASLIPYAAERRNAPALQMPPIDTNVPDLADIAMLKDWITNGNFGP